VPFAALLAGASCQIPLEVPPPSGAAAAHYPWHCIIIQRLRVQEHIEIINQATGDAVGQVSVATASEIQELAARARKAQREWSSVSFNDRARIIRRFHHLILTRRDQILDTIQSETGKARRDALAEIITVAGTARYYLSHGREHL